MSLLMQWTEHGLARRMSPDGRPEGDCHKTDGFLFLAGSGRTDASGMWQLHVHDAVCEPLGAVQWISLVATPSHHHEVELPHADTDSMPEFRPGFVTTTWTASGGHAVLTVRSWTCHCERMPNVEFSYHAAIAHVFLTSAAE